MPQPMITWGGAGDVLVFAPANGFPPEAYRPLLQRLSAQARIVLAPPRALWPGPPPPDSSPGWDTLAEDLLEGISRERLGPVVAVGHSFGAVAALLAAARQPAAFRALALLDATILPPEADAVIAHWRAQPQPHPLVQGALRRRAHFSSREQAFAYWRAKPLFHDWSDAALWAYVEAGLVPDEADGLRLAWPPEWEAHYFNTMPTGLWTALGQLPPGLPLLFVRGAHSDTLLPHTLELLRLRLPWAHAAEAPGGHLFPLTAPDETAALVAEYVANLRSPED